MAQTFRVGAMHEAFGTEGVHLFWGPEHEATAEAKRIAGVAGHGWSPFVVPTITEAEAAVRGLDVTVRSGVVVVSDGEDTWVCLESAWDFAIAKLSEREANPDDTNGVEAYGALCSKVRAASPIASVNGSPKGEWQPLVHTAVKADLIDGADTHRMFGVSFAD